MPGVLSRARGLRRLGLQDLPARAPRPLQSRGRPIRLARSRSSRWSVPAKKLRCETISFPSPLLHLLHPPPSQGNEGDGCRSLPTWKLLATSGHHTHRTMREGQAARSGSTRARDRPHLSCTGRHRRTSQIHKHMLLGFTRTVRNWQWSHEICVGTLRSLRRVLSQCRCRVKSPAPAVHRANTRQTSLGVHDHRLCAGIGRR